MFLNFFMWKLRKRLILFLCNTPKISEFRSDLNKLKYIIASFNFIAIKHIKIKYIKKLDIKLDGQNKRSHHLRWRLELSD